MKTNAKSRMLKTVFVFALVLLSATLSGCFRGGGIGDGGGLLGLGLLGGGGGFSGGDGVLGGGGGGFSGGSGG